MQTGDWIFTVVIFTILWSLSYFIRKRVFFGARNPAQRRWDLVGMPFSIVWVLSLICVDEALKKSGVTNQIQFRLGIAMAALSGLGSIWWMHHWLRKADEMVRRIEIEAMALAFGLSIVVATVTSQLARAKVGLFTDDLGPGTTHLMRFFMVWAIARVTVYLRYQ